MRFVDKIKIVKVSKNSDILNQKPKKIIWLGGLATKLRSLLSKSAFPKKWYYYGNATKPTFLYPKLRPLKQWYYTGNATKPTFLFPKFRPLKQWYYPGNATKPTFLYPKLRPLKQWYYPGNATKLAYLSLRTKEVHTKYSVQWKGAVCGVPVLEKIWFRRVRLQPHSF